jgi:hypothetical protein
MLENLNELIERQQRESEPATQRWLRYAGVFVVSLVAFGALYAGIKFLE